MNPRPGKVVLNHALFAVRALDSSALAIRGAIFHRFATPGQYQVLVARGGRTVHREQVQVASEQGTAQVDVDLGNPDDEARCDCGRRSGQGAKIVTGGVMAFYATRGTATYTVRIDRLGDRAKETVLDSAKSLPAGDLFSATLVVPGTYSVLVDDARVAAVRVRMPDPKHPHRTDRPVLLQIPAPTGHEPSVELDAGCSLVLLLIDGGRVRVEPVDVIKRAR